jgi:hypothetical protein
MIFETCQSIGEVGTGDLWDTSLPYTTLYGFVGVHPKIITRLLLSLCLTKNDTMKTY